MNLLSRILLSVASSLLVLGMLLSLSASCGAGASPADVLAAIRAAVDARTFLSVTVYPDVLGEGGSDSKGQNLAALEAACEYIRNNFGPVFES